MKKRIDPRETGVPNICFSLGGKDEEREEEFKKQRLERGFDDSETWSLADTFANFMIPRLERYAEIVEQGANGDDGVNEELPDLRKVILALKLLVRDEGIRLYSKEEGAQVEEGLTLMGETFQGWWW